LPTQAGKKNEDLAFYANYWKKQKGGSLGGMLGSIAPGILPLAQKYIFPHAKSAILNIFK